MLTQQFGHATRDPSLNAVAVLLAPASAFDKEDKPKKCSNDSANVVAGASLCHTKGRTSGAEDISDNNDSYIEAVVSQPFNRPLNRSDQTSDMSTMQIEPVPRGFHGDVDGDVVIVGEGEGDVTMVGVNNEDFLQQTPVWAPISSMTQDPAGMRASKVARLSLKKPSKKEKVE